MVSWAPEIGYWEGWEGFPEGLWEKMLIDCSRHRTQRVSRRCSMYVYNTPWSRDVSGWRRVEFGKMDEDCADRCRLRGRRKRSFRNVSLNPAAIKMCHIC